MDSAAPTKRDRFNKNRKKKSVGEMLFDQSKEEGPVQVVVDDDEALNSRQRFTRFSTDSLKRDRAGSLRAASLSPNRRFAIQAMRDSFDVQLPSDEDMTAASTTTKDEEDAHEQLQKIKARTMYDMLEEVGDGQQLLFLTNKQADMISSSHASLQKMLDVLDVSKPKLVIVLVPSLGWDPAHDYAYLWQNYEYSDWFEGLPPKTLDPPFQKVEEGKPKPDVQADQSIDRFMADVLIPLAAQTNAIVIASALENFCTLSRSFTRMVEVLGSKWGKTLPFTVLSCTKDVDCLYRNKDQNAVWRKLCQQSRSWKRRDKVIQDCVEADPTHLRKDGTLIPNDCDLDSKCSCYVVVDNLTVSKHKQHKLDAMPYNRLVNELTRYLAGTIPSIAIKTGGTPSVVLGEINSAAALGVSLSICQSGIPLLFLDVVERPLAMNSESRQAWIQDAKDHHDKKCDVMVGSGYADLLDVCSIAYFKKVLHGEADKEERKEFDKAKRKDFDKEKRKDSDKEKCMDPDKEKFKDSGKSLYAILSQIPDVHSGTLTREHMQDHEPQHDWEKASDQDVDKVASWLANRRYSDAWKLHPDRQKLEPEFKSYASYYKRKILAHCTCTRTLLSSSNFHVLNVVEDSQQKQQALVTDLVKLDRLPKHNTLEGLLLLQEAWCEYDVAMYLASRYKLIFKILFRTQLLIGWLVVSGSAVISFPEMRCKKKDVVSWLQKVIFILTVAMSLMISIESFLNAKSRWSALRLSAGSLKSLIWQFRARVGNFEVDHSRPHASGPEVELREVLNAWREDLVSSASLANTSLVKNNPDKVYRHGQYCEKLEGDDDFHTPVRPEKYIKFRIESALEFYKNRIPGYVRSNQNLRWTMMLLGVASSVLAYFEFMQYTTLVTSAATAATSWSEFSDKQRKIERYTRAVTSLKKLLSWWKSLDAVEKASTENISMLVSSSEAIICEESFAWISTSKKKPSHAPSVARDVPTVPSAKNE